MRSVDYKWSASLAPKDGDDHTIFDTALADVRFWQTSEAGKPRIPKKRRTDRLVPMPEARGKRQVKCDTQPETRRLKGAKFIQCKIQPPPHVLRAHDDDDQQDDQVFSLSMPADASFKHFIA